jgi:serine protease Do
VTVGVLSAKDREAKYKDEVLFRDILQTDAAVNPGSSGGPLLNLEGRLMGINVAIYPDAQNIGFAVPIKRARDLLGQWLSPRLLKNSWLGFEAEAGADSLCVAHLDPEGPAARAGVHAGDRIIAVNDQPVTSLFDFNRMLLRAGPGDPVRLQLRHGDVTQTVSLAFAELPKPSGKKLAKSLLGLEFEENAEDLVARYGKGLPIAQVRPGSSAEALGLRPGLFVSRINDVKINSIDDVGVALANVRPADMVSMLVVNITEAESLVLARSSTVQMRAEP